MPHLSKFIIRQLSSTYLFLCPTPEPLVLLPYPPSFLSSFLPSFSFPTSCLHEQQSAISRSCEVNLWFVEKSANWMQHKLFTMLMGVLLYWSSEMPLKCFSSHHHRTLSFTVCVCVCLSSQHISTFPLFLSSRLTPASSYHPPPCLHVSVEYMMDDVERKSIVEEPVRMCPVPVPRTSVPSPSASPSLRHKSEYTQ